MTQLNYYVEVNFICMILLVFVYGRLRQNKSIVTAPQIALRRMVAATMVLCLTDIAACALRGQMFSGARHLIELANLLFLEMMPIIAMFWYFFVCYRLEIRRTKRHVLLFQLPLILFTILAFVNPWTHFLFRIDENNLYSRGPGVFLHWIVSWFYFLAAAYYSARKYYHAENMAQRMAYRPLLQFIILPAIGCLLQMAVYGVTTVQVGITLSIVLVSIRLQDNQISADELTGINNRKAMRLFVENIIHRYGAPTVTVMMIDVNKFKKINDSFGHTAGDAALQDTAKILREVCASSRESLFLCRYGGDEFVIIGMDMTPDGSQALTDSIHGAVKEFTSVHKKPYELSFSIGAARGRVESYDDFSHYLRTADESMYEDKKASR